MSANGETVPDSTSSEMNDIKGKGKGVATEPEMTMEEDDDEEETADEDDVSQTPQNHGCRPQLTAILLRSNLNRKVHNPPLHTSSVSQSTRLSVTPALPFTYLMRSKESQETKLTPFPDDEMEAIDMDNIVDGRTRRKQINWAEAEAKSKAAGDDLDDDEEDDDEDFEAPEEEDEEMKG